MNNSKTKKIVVSSMLGAITVILGLTPLGFIPLGIINATTMHIPVIVGAILEGPVVGASIGLIFGLSSFIKAFMSPTPISFVFYNPLISILPRVLIGIVSYYVYAALADKDKKFLKIISYILYPIFIIFLSYLLYQNIVSAHIFNAVLTTIFLITSIILAYITYKSDYNNFAITASAFIGSMTNTVLVLGGIYLMYAQPYMEKIGKPIEQAKSAILGVSITSGLPEAVICVLITTVVVNSVSKIKMDSAIYNEKKIKTITD
ncbi:MAG: ECF transporter S component [Peptoanaerobacter stomatis]|uniref:ECF transporter S component n=1 Tax=Peptoanaerobacter stomatis TaxID=796937 RepID=UPI003FA12EDF